MAFPPASWISSRFFCSSESSFMPVPFRKLISSRMVRILFAAFSKLDCPDFFLGASILLICSETPRCKIGNALFASSNSFNCSFVSLPSCCSFFNSFILSSAREAALFAFSLWILSCSFLTASVLLEYSYIVRRAEGRVRFSGLSRAFSDNPALLSMSMACDNPAMDIAVSSAVVPASLICWFSLSSFAWPVPNF